MFKITRIKLLSIVYSEKLYFYGKRYRKINSSFKISPYSFFQINTKTVEKHKNNE